MARRDAFTATARNPAAAERVVGWLLLALLGAGLGAGGVVAWRHALLPPLNWIAVLAVAIFLNTTVALQPMWQRERRRKRQAELLRFRLWMHFSKLRWLLTHLDQQDPTRTFFSPGLGGEELTGIEVLLAQADVLDIDEYEWVIFTVNAALPYFGRPVAEVASQAVRLLWTVDATLAHLNRLPAQRNDMR